MEHFPDSGGVWLDDGPSDERLLVFDHTAGWKRPPPRLPHPPHRAFYGPLFQGQLGKEGLFLVINLLLVYSKFPLAASYLP